MISGGGMLARNVLIKTDSEFDSGWKDWLHEAYDRS